MQFTPEDVRKVARLANLELTADEIAHLAHDMAEVLTHMEQLAELDTTGVEPMAQVLFAASPTATLRADQVRESTHLTNADALANAPLSGSGHFKVPRVIER